MTEPRDPNDLPDFEDAPEVEPEPEPASHDDADNLDVEPH